jgi:hypothetical protein
VINLIFILLFPGNHLPANAGINQINRSESVNCFTKFKITSEDSLLMDIQDKIYNAFIKARISQKNDALNELSNQLENLYKSKNQNLILYWRSYLQYYSSIDYFIKADNKSAENEIKKGIELMASIEKKNSEDYALLAMLQSFSIQFNSLKAMFISGDVKKNADNAITLDSANLRAWFVYGSNDFHTPAQYGGGKKTEKYLLKAISLPAQRTANGYLPSWGKEESYALLIRFYIQKGNWDMAKKYFQIGITAFPESYVISQLASKIAGK